MNHWQLCPKCDGTGECYIQSTWGYRICDVCNGQKIINQFTGKPPSAAGKIIKQKDKRYKSDIS